VEVVGGQPATGGADEREGEDEGSAHHGFGWTYAEARETHSVPPRSVSHPERKKLEDRAGEGYPTRAVTPVLLVVTARTCEPTPGCVPFPSSSASWWCVPPRRSQPPRTSRARGRRPSSLPPKGRALLPSPPSSSARSASCARRTTGAEGPELRLRRAATTDFQLRNARFGVEGVNEEYHLRFQVSAEGASDIQDRPNTPQGTLELRLRDAFVRYDFAPWLGVEVGQFKAPFDAEGLRPTEDLLFASRAIGQEGVLVGNGFEEPGIVIDRELGVMLSPEKPIRVGPITVGYYAMIANGNGQNQLRNDNNDHAFLGRLELWLWDIVRIGGAGIYNQRTVGTLPNLYGEKDVGVDVDAMLLWKGLEVSGQIVRMTTTFTTTGRRTAAASHGTPRSAIASTRSSCRSSPHIDSPSTTRGPGRAQRRVST